MLHSIYGFTTIYERRASGSRARTSRTCSPNAKLKDAGIAYILQDNSVFPDMTVEENLLMGGYLMGRPRQAKAARTACSTATRGWPSGAASAPACSRAASGVCWRSRAR